MCFYMGYHANDLAVQAAALRYGSKWRLCGADVYLDVVEWEPTQ